MTAVVRDLALAFPGRYEIGVAGTWTPVWKHNPYLAPWSPVFATPDNPQHPGVPKDTPVFELTYKDVIPRAKKEEIHFLRSFYVNLERQSGIKVPCLTPRPDLHLSPKEIARPLVSGRYWIITSGGKLDLTTKHWDPQKYQLVVDMLRPYGIRFVQTGATHNGHTHPPLKNVLNLVGYTDDVRDFFNLVYHADGVICPITSAMHIAAAFEKPCVCIAGGREDPHWEGYANHKGFGPDASPVTVPHVYLHTIGQLGCCDVGCWKKRTVPIEPEDHNGKGPSQMCREPRRTATGFSLPLCMQMITADHVAEAVMGYYDRKVLPPLGEPSRAYAVPPQAPPFPEMEDPVMIRSPSVEYKPPRPTVLDPVPATPEVPLNGDVFDHPRIGGKFTFCALFYGDHEKLARRCMASVLNTVPRERLDLRLACNQCVPGTLEYLRSLEPTKMYVASANRLKYPVMRDMFWDPECPLTTPWLVWFDDDSFVNARDWLLDLAKTIVAQPSEVGMIGAKFVHHLQPYVKKRHDPRDWFKQGRWFKNRPFQDRRGQPAPNGDYIHFVAGGCWGASVAALRQSDVPDIRLEHRGDIAIGHQMWQAGYVFKDWNRDKSKVKTSAHDRRGVDIKQMPWQAP